MAALGEDLLSTVNKLQDLVFNTIGSDSLDLPQIVSCAHAQKSIQLPFRLIPFSLGRRWLAVSW